jgi:hypothetical protein
MLKHILRKGLMFYEVAKFQDSNFTTAIYQFTQRRCTYSASCSSCKYTKVIKTQYLGTMYVA